MSAAVISADKSKGKIVEMSAAMISADKSKGKEGRFVRSCEHSGQK
ncbi:MULTISPECIES: hypothetical protein [Bacillaceae]|uniref:Uncharacterized protein n=1 Tax=Evansella alkalicola TaxID=745819 RepID=A0ABS6JR37_9BACI|nr:MULTISPECIES: hypothetical protein [Bacillaceae]MBU9720571.1 hypothetical protein [Bacillus alkalicola]